MLQDIMLNKGTHFFSYTGPDLRDGPLIKICENGENGQSITIPISALEHILKCIDPDTGFGKYEKLIDDTILECIGTEDIEYNPFLAVIINKAVSELVYSLIDTRDKDGKYPYENIKEMVLQLSKNENVIKEAKLLKYLFRKKMAIKSQEETSDENITSE